MWYNLVYTIIVFKGDKLPLPSNDISNTFKPEEKYADNILNKLEVFPDFNRF